MKLAPRTLLLSLALAVCALAAAPEAYACSCMSRRPVCDAFGGADAVFVGKVVGAAEQKTETEDDGTKITYDVGSIYFAVEEAFSGVKAGTRVTIRSGTGGADCGYWFKRGERYLVYAYGDAKKGLHTNVCTRTSTLAAAAADLPFLRSLPPEGAGVRLYGAVIKYPFEARDKGERREPAGEDGQPKAEGIAGITVTIEDAKGRQREVVTDAEGRYEVQGLKPGEYEVSAALPDYYYKSELSKHEIIVRDRGCAEASFDAIPDGRITGSVLDAEGKPLPKAKVVLIHADAGDYLTMDDEVATDYVGEDERGRFELGQVPPGEYLLGLNVTFSPDEDEPYAPTFYPGVRDRALATVIKVALGQKLKDYVLRAPPRLTERTVQGFVHWPDGTPAVGAHVHLTDRNHPGWIANGSTQTDAQGRFTLTGFDGITYWVLASMYASQTGPAEKRRETHAEPPSVTLTSNVSGLKLVLTSEGTLCKHYYTEKPRR